MVMYSVKFIPINLKASAKICVQFRRDAFICSFGSSDSFDTEYGKDGSEYLEWLRKRSDELPGSCVHLWQNNKIVGQMEMGLRKSPLIGYVNLFYIVSEFRGSNIGQEMQNYAKNFFGNHDVTKAQLSVSPSNTRAISYYLKHGWVDLGARLDRPELNLMEINYSD
ncbi:MAG TPA: GNAT family N-acetyltransferase [Xenococcaceae cyanobacterium]